MPATLLDARETLDVLGPSIQFLTRLSDNDDDCLIWAALPTGADRFTVIPNGKRFI